MTLMDGFSRSGRAAGLLVALGAAALASCGGHTSVGFPAVDASVDSSAGGTGGSSTGGSGGTAATGGSAATGGTGATGGYGGAPDPCGNVTCNAPANCLNGKCWCPGGLHYCGGACVDTQTDLSNCGVCGHACQSGADCIAGQCQMPGTCTPAFCPTAGYGTACCLTPNGPCGVDYGFGCVNGYPQDAGP